MKTKFHFLVLREKFLPLLQGKQAKPKHIPPTAPKEED